MTVPRSAVAVLVDRRRQGTVSAPGAIGLSLLGLLIFATMPKAQLTVLAAEGVVAGAMLVCYAAECRELDRLLRGRFLEYAMLTGVDASEISDGLLWAGLRGLIPLLTLVYAVGLLAANASSGLVQAALWLPAVDGLVLTVFFYQQLRAVYRLQSGRQYLVSAALAGYGLAVVVAWLTANVDLALLLVLLGAVGFALCRKTVQAGIDRMLREPEEKVLRLVPARIDRNPLTRREMCRAQRRWGQPVRSALLVAVFLIAGVVYWPYRTAAGVALWALSYGLVAATMAYWATWKMLEEERQSGRDSLLKLSRLKFADYLEGWTTASTYPHRIELVIVHLVAAAALIGQMDWRAGLSQAAWLGLTGYVLIRTAPTLALCSSGAAHSWLGALTGLLLAGAGFFGVVSLPCVLAWCMSDGNVAATAAGLAVTGISLQGFLRGWAEGSFMDDDGNLQLPGD